MVKFTARRVAAFMGSGVSAAAVVSALRTVPLPWSSHGGGDGDVPRPASSDRMAAHSVAWASPAATKAGHVVAGLPEYTVDDVAKHNGKKGGEKSIWVMYKGGVYDVTQFIDTHPGGANRIKLAAGGRVDPFWQTFKIHNSDEVRHILEGMRIGNVKGYVEKAEPAGAQGPDPWAFEPERHAALAARSSAPFNAETPNDVLAASILTPNELFFVRNHMPVPIVDDKTFCLRVEGEGVKRNCFTVAELTRMFPTHTLTTTIQCGGNRRSEFPAENVKGLPWKSGAVSTASWTGVWLRDILAFASSNNLTQANMGAAVAESGHHGATHHVHFDGLDEDPSSNFQVSIPLSMALDPNRDCLIAYQMNGQPIPRDHGYPLRAIVPGTVGVRNCKWLKKITVASEESQSDWQQRDYKMYPSWLTKPEPGHASVYDMPIQSSITEATRDGADITVKGYAWCGGGRGVQRVDISDDGGNSFKRSATLDDGGLRQADGHRWAWQLFEANFEAKSETEPVTVCSRAWSTTLDVQPQSVESNFRGLWYNAYSCVKL